MKSRNLNPFPHMVKSSPLMLLIIAWLLFGSTAWFPENPRQPLLSMIVLSGVVAFLSVLKLLSNKYAAAYQLWVILLGVLLIGLDIFYFYIFWSGLCCV
jgi:hypothetical protein